MAKTSFANPGSAAPAAQPVIDISSTAVNSTPAAAPEQSAAPAVIPPTTVATPVNTAPYGDNSDNIDANDVVFPRINIVQKVGDLSNVFPGGAIVLDKSLVLFECEVKDASGKVIKPASAPINVVIIGFGQTKYTEKLQGGALGRQLDSVAAVVAAGGTVNYNEAKSSGKTLFEQTEEALIIIEQPAIADAATPSFPFEAGGKQYAVAKWSMKGTAFTHAAKLFMTARKIGVLRKDLGKTYADGVWAISTTLKSFNGNWYFQPVVQLQAAPTPAPVKELATLVLG